MPRFAYTSCMASKLQSEVVSFRAPRVLVAALEKMAKTENRNRANMVVHLLTEALKRTEEAK
jgi:hypothetical protein